MCTEIEGIMLLYKFQWLRCIISRLHSCGLCQLAKVQYISLHNRQLNVCKVGENELPLFICRNSGLLLPRFVIV